MSGRDRQRIFETNPTIEFVKDMLDNIYDVTWEVLNSLPDCNRDIIFKNLPHHISLVKTIKIKNNQVERCGSVIIVDGYRYDRSYVWNSCIETRVMQFLMGLVMDKNFTRQLGCKYLKDLRRIVVVYIDSFPLPLPPP